MAPLALLLLGLSCSDGVESVADRTRFCRSFCEANAACEDELSRSELAVHGAAVCESEADALTPCIQACHSALLEPGREFEARDCMECWLDAGASVCRTGRDECYERCGEADLAVTGAAWQVLRAQSCWFGDPAPPEVCVGASAYVSVHVQPPGDFLQNFTGSYTGTATVTGTSPLTFSAPGGQVYALSARGTNPPVLLQGEVLTLEFQQSCPFGCRSRVALRGLDGALLWAAWATDGPVAPLPELAILYRPAACRGTWRDGWGSIALELQLPDGRSVPPDGDALHGRFLVRNGASVARFAIRATDTSLDWRSGAVERLADD